MQHASAATLCNVMYEANIEVAYAPYCAIKNCRLAYARPNFKATKKAYV